MLKFKTKVSVGFTFILIIAAMLFTSNKLEQINFSREMYDSVKTSTIHNIWPHRETVYVEPVRANNKIKGDVLKFMRAIARAESGGNSTVVNNTGHLGKYQFNIKTLRGLGIDADIETFLADEVLQDSAMVLNMKRNKQILNRVIRNFNGMTMDGITVTTSGILAAAHLVGPGGVLSYFYPEEYGHPIADGNGTHITHYMAKFSNYNIKI